MRWRGLSFQFPDLSLLVPCFLVVYADDAEVDDVDGAVVVDVSAGPSGWSGVLVVEADDAEVDDVDGAVVVDVVVGCFGVDKRCGGVGVVLGVGCGDGEGVGAVLVEGGGVVGVGVVCGVCEVVCCGGGVGVGDGEGGVLYAVGVGDGGGDVFPAVCGCGVLWCAVGECGVGDGWWCGVLYLLCFFLSYI